MIKEASLASKPIIQLRGEPLGLVKWTPEEAKRLFKSVRQWWSREKVIINSASLKVNPVMEALKHVGHFLCRAIIPALKSADPLWEELFLLLKDMRNAGAYPTIVWPYMLEPV
jgi:hypothetical protein